MVAAAINRIDMSPKLIGAALLVVALAFIGCGLTAPGRAFAKDGTPAATPSNPDADCKEKRRDRGYDWSSIYHSYRSRYEPDHERYGNSTGAKASAKESTKQSAKTVRRKNDGSDGGYDWRSAYRHYSDRDWGSDERRDRRKRRHDDD
jgi:hypothetical protein